MVSVLVMSVLVLRVVKGLVSGDEVLGVVSDVKEVIGESGEATRQRGW
jgi:hypothetical protein